MPCSPQKLEELKVFDAKVSALYQQQKLSTYQIAERLGCSQGKVAKALNRAGAKMRSFSEAISLAQRF